MAPDMKADLESSLSNSKVINIKLAELEQKFDKFESLSPKADKEKKMAGPNISSQKNFQGTKTIYQ